MNEREVELTRSFNTATQPPVQPPPRTIDVQISQSNLLYRIHNLSSLLVPPDSNLLISVSSSSVGSDSVKRVGFVEVRVQDRGGCSLRESKLRVEENVEVLVLGLAKRVGEQGEEGKVELV